MQWILRSHGQQEVTFAGVLTASAYLNPSHIFKQGFKLTSDSYMKLQKTSRTLAGDGCCWKSICITVWCGSLPYFQKELVVAVGKRYMISPTTIFVFRISLTVNLWMYGTQLKKTLSALPRLRRRPSSKRYLKIFTRT